MSLSNQGGVIIASTTANPYTVTFSLAANVRLLVLSIIGATTTARGGGAPDYNGVVFTQAGTTQAGSAECSTELWYLPNPDTGSIYTLTVPNTGALTLRIMVTSYWAGATVILDQTTQSGVTRANPFLTINNAPAGGLVFDVLGSGYKDIIAGSTGGSVIWSTDETAWNTAEKSLFLSAQSNITFSYVQASDDVAYIMASFKEFVSYVGPTARRKIMIG